MQLFHGALTDALANPALPRPHEPEWDEYLACLQAGVEEQLGPLDPPEEAPEPEPLVRVSITPVYGEKGFQPFRDRSSS